MLVLIPTDGVADTTFVGLASSTDSAALTMSRVDTGDVLRQRQTINDVRSRTFHSNIHGGLLAYQPPADDVDEK